MHKNDWRPLAVQLVVTAVGGERGTIGDEKQRNDALTTDDEDAFVETLIANLTAYPAYYAHMGALNRGGPTAPNLAPPAPLQARQLRTRIDAGEWVVDLRDRTAYAASHVHGSVGIALGNQFSTYVGWLMPWGTPLSLIGDSAEQVADAQRMLVRIGVDELQGAATGFAEKLVAGTPTSSYPRRTFIELPDNIVAADKATHSDAVLLDVRRDDEPGASEGGTGGGEPEHDDRDEAHHSLEDTFEQSLQIPTIAECARSARKPCSSRSRRPSGSSSPIGSSCSAPQLRQTR